MKNKVTAEMLQRLNEELGGQSTVVPSQRTDITPSSPTVFQARLSALEESDPETPHQVAKLMSALEVLSPDALRGNGKLYEPGDAGTSQNYWLIVIWAIASLGWQRGKDIARKWSQQSARYTEEGFEAAWDAFDPSRPRPIGIGSLYKLATEHGRLAQVSIPLQPVSANDARYKLLSPADIHSIPAQQWRIKSILPATGIAAIFGPSGSGKSFLAVHMAAAIATGRKWFGKRTRQAHVVYVMLEGEGGIRNRIAALERNQGPLPSAQFNVVIQTFHLTAPQDVADLAAVIPDGAVVIIDTLNRAAPMVDENSSKDMGLKLLRVRIISIPSTPPRGGEQHPIYSN